MTHEPRLRIPSDDYDRVALLVALTDEQVEELVATLTSTPPSPSRLDFVGTVANRTKLLDSQSARNVLLLLLNLYRVRNDLYANVPTFVEAFVQAVKRAGVQTLHPPHTDWVAFERRLSELLSSQSLAIVAKASALWLEYGPTFHDAHIASDIRPVFGDDANQAPVAALLVHTLKLSYHADDHVQDIQVALEPEDIEKLSKVLDRARAKAAQLRILLDTIDLPLLGVDAE